MKSKILQFTKQNIHRGDFGLVACPTCVPLAFDVILHASKKSATTKLCFSLSWFSEGTADISARHLFLSLQYTVRSRG